MVNSRKCIYCQERWPEHEDFKLCPCCREPTEYAYMAPTLSPEQANELRKTHSFGWWLWDTGRFAR